MIKVSVAKVTRKSRLWGGCIYVVQPEHQRACLSQKSNVMKKQHLILVALATCVALSFTGYPPPKIDYWVAGVYSGSCACGEPGESSSSKIELILNEDFSFRYFNNANPSKVTDVKGRWTLTENTILLTGYDANQSIPHKWKITGEDKCLKSRKGLEFLRLCYAKTGK